MTPTLPPENIYGHTKKLLYILRQIDLAKAAGKRPVKLLDFGCGNGQEVSQYLIQDGVQYVGVDMHAPSRDYATRHFGRENAVFLESIPAGERFDLIVYADVLEHLENPATLLAEHRELLADDGVMVASIPNGYGPYEIEMYLGRKLGLLALLEFTMKKLGRNRQSALRDTQAEELPYNHESGHLQFFTRRSLKRTLAQAGLALDDFAHGVYICGSFSNTLVHPAIPFSAIGRRWNTKLANVLPAWMVATWYFTIKRASAQGAR